MLAWLKCAHCSCKKVAGSRPVWVLNFVMALRAEYSSLATDVYRVHMHMGPWPFMSVLIAAACWLVAEGQQIPGQPSQPHPTGDRRSQRCHLRNNESDLYLQPTKVSPANAAVWRAGIRAGHAHGVNYGSCRHNGNTADSQAGLLVQCHLRQSCNFPQHLLSAQRCARTHEEVKASFVGDRWQLT